MKYNKKRGLRNSIAWPLLSAGPIATEFLIRQLNVGTGGAAKALRELVRDFNQLEEIGRTHGFPDVNIFQKFSSHPEAYPGYDESSVKLMKKLQATFKSYRLVPMPAYPQKDGWKFHWRHPWGTGSNTNRDFRWVFHAVIHDLAVAGRLRRVRECDFCHKWFFGRRDDQGFCSPSCREKDWRTSPRGRTKRAAYMRRYRQGQDRANKNALKAANDRERKGRHSYRK
jgi:hypothetical protein